MSEVSAKSAESGAASGSRWSFQVATLLGIPIRVHVTFLALLVWFATYAAAMARDVKTELAFVVGVFTCVVLHELGHAAMAKRFGVKTREIVLYPIGGVARLERIPGGVAELLIALAGPAVNAVIGAALSIVLVAVGAPIDLSIDFPFQDGLVQKLLWSNVMLVLFNMIPAFPMDGGRVLRGLLAISLGQDRATRIAAIVGQLFAVLFAVLGLWSGNFLLVFIGVFVFLGATQEAAYQRGRSAVAGRVAKDAMISRFEVLRPQDSLGRAAELLLATHQHDFPVLDAWDRVAGVLPRVRLLEELARSGSGTPVLDVMQRDPVVVAPGTPLDAVLQHLQADPARPLLVVEDGKLAGMLTLENLSEFIVIARQIPKP
ncbi:MAG TPA: site-2 protease family protein [Candidatus Bathyarchaeia archaeon]|nr:site-2 protease family protein [Candidatus Bathyarchaeia archaeon]